MVAMILEEVLAYGRVCIGTLDAIEKYFSELTMLADYFGDR